MAAPESEQVIFIEEGDDEYSTDSGGSDPGYDSDLDPSYSPLEDTHATFSKLSIGKKSKSRIGKDLDVGVDEIEEKVIQKIIEAGQQEKLKVEQCKVYLRNNGLRLTGNKPTLIQRIKEHLEISNGGGERRFNIAACSASGPPCGKRIVAGRIMKESYGAAKQQHTFTIEVLWSKGEKPLPPLRPLLIKGRNLYRLKTLRQRWEDEGERHKVLMEKHSRGFIARSNREIRIHGKEKRKLLKANRMSINQVPKSCQSQMNLTVTEKVEILSQQQLALNMDSNQMKNGPQQLSVQPQKPSLSVDHRKVAAQPQLSADSKKAAKLLSQLVEQELAVMQNNCQTQVPQDPIVKLSSIREAPINRQRLKSINHHPPTCPPQEQSCMKQQLRPYYPKGRCYFGDNCKFLHEQRDNGDQRREYRWHHGLPRQSERRGN
ncbi:zinc finger CCCH domain-containing protein 62-like [Citrus sinensis]|uniref:zinc finger CCCH domain-containing protein 62-like n=1 Tax=Citrus sinensis TaxID=2711 RepID=UPI0022785E2D|nr:zinc finger CCCH domain-containing protein 62-like [Citrus sinensis]